MAGRNFSNCNVVVVLGSWYSITIMPAKFMSTMKISQLNIYEEGTPSSSPYLPPRAGVRPATFLNFAGFIQNFLHTHITYILSPPTFFSCSTIFSSNKWINNTSFTINKSINQHNKHSKFFFFTSYIYIITNLSSQTYSDIHPNK